MSHHLRFITYNIRKGKGASGFAASRVDELGGALSQLRPDLVLCQEVSHLYDPRVSQSDELGLILGLTSYYQPNKHRRDGHHGNATFTHHEVVRARNYDISTNRIERRGVLYIGLRIGGTPVHVFNAHLGLNQAQRLVQVHRIAELVREHAGADEPVLLAGDFNDWNRRLERTIVAELGFVNTLGHLPLHTVTTWHARRPVFMLDRVYARGLVAVSAKRLEGHPWQDLSDHLPLLVDLQLPQVTSAAA